MPDATLIQPDDEQRRMLIAPPDVGALPLTPGRVPVMAAPSAGAVRPVTMPAPVTAVPGRIAAPGVAPTQTSAPQSKPTTLIAPPDAAPAHEGFLSSLYHRKVAAPQPGQPDTRIKNRFLRDVAGLGLGVARDVEGFATPFVPELAFVPGTEANATAQNNAEARGRAAAAKEAEETAQGAAVTSNAASNKQNAATKQREVANAEAEQPSIIAKNEGEAAQAQHNAQKPFNSDKALKAYTVPGSDAPIYVAEDQQPPAGAVPYKAASTTEPHITIMGKDGQAHIMERDPATGQYSVDRGIAPPNYSQTMASTKTVQLLGPNGVETWAYNPDTKRFDIPVGLAGTGEQGSRGAQAAAVNRGGERLISDLQANRDKLGDLSAWVKKYGLNTPIADPDLAGLQTELSTFAALQPAMHGFRSKSALDTFEKIIGGVQKNPEATIASIRAIIGTAGAVNPEIKSPAESTETPSFSEWQAKQKKRK